MLALQRIFVRGRISLFTNPKRRGPCSALDKHYTNTLSWSHLGRWQNPADSTLLSLPPHFLCTSSSCWFCCLKLHLLLQKMDWRENTGKEALVHHFHVSPFPRSRPLRVALPLWIWKMGEALLCSEPVISSAVNECIHMTIVAVKVKWDEQVKFLVQWAFH